MSIYPLTPLFGILLGFSLASQASETGTGLEYEPILEVLSRASAKTISTISITYQKTDQLIVSGAARSADAVSTLFDGLEQSGNFNEVKFNQDTSAGGKGGEDFRFSISVGLNVSEGKSTGQANVLSRGQVLHVYERLEQSCKEHDSAIRLVNHKPDSHGTVVRCHWEGLAANLAPVLDDMCSLDMPGHLLSVRMGKSSTTRESWKGEFIMKFTDKSPPTS